MTKADEKSKRANGRNWDFVGKGHPFMTSTRSGGQADGGSGSDGRTWTGEGSSPLWTSTQKIINRVR